MKHGYSHAAHLVCGLFCFALLSSASAVEIRGKVQSASGESADLVVEGDSNPSVGDTVSIFFKMEGLDEEVGVGSGTVTAVSADGIKAHIDEASGTVAKDQLVRIISSTPTKKLAATPSSPMVPPLPSPTVTPQASIPEPPARKATAREITFNDLPLGPLAADAFSNDGVRIEPHKGAPEIFAAQPNMVLPARRKKVMLVGGGPVTSVSIVFEPPVKRITIFRVGTDKGASTPTWTMTAYNRSGNGVGTTGEDRGLPQRPKSFTLEDKSITSVRINTDNRNGTSTWATWNSLPIASFSFER